MMADVNFKHLAEFFLFQKVSDRSCRENYDTLSCQAKILGSLTLYGIISRKIYTAEQDSPQKTHNMEK